MTMDPLGGPEIQFIQFDELRQNESLLINGSEDSNSTTPMMTADMKFTVHSLTFIFLYAVCFAVAAIGNLTVFVTLSRGRYRKSRFSLMICHLSIADLIVAFFMIPIEIGWRVTVEWLAGNLACKVAMFVKAFGLYLSNNILVCASLDRYFAVLHPLRVNEARKRGKLMIAIAWICSTLFAIPQLFVFNTRVHDAFPNFVQCVTYGSFGSETSEKLYSLFNVAVFFFIPLTIICWVYLRIFCEISSQSKEGSRGNLVKANKKSDTLSSSGSSQGSKMRLRRSDVTCIERAKSRTLRMTIKIVAAFIICWTPYTTMTLWYIFDRASARNVNRTLQDSLFFMAVGNSCANPIVYGSYAVDLRKECCRYFFPCIRYARPTRHNQKMSNRSTQGTVGAKRNQTQFSGVNGKLFGKSSNRFSMSGTDKDDEKVPLHTMKVSFKDTVLKPSCSEPADANEIRYKTTVLTTNCTRNETV